MYMKKRKVTTAWEVQVAILSALAIILYNFPKFQLPFFPGMLSVQFSMLPTIIGGFALGPVGGIYIVLIKFIFKLLTTRSAGVGEFVDLIIGVCVVLVTSLIYKYIKSKKGAIIALIMGSITWVVVAVILNWLWAIPFYCNTFGMDKVIGMIMVIPGVNESNYMSKYLLFGCLPFNLMLASVVSIVTYIIYKRVSWLFEKMTNKIEKKNRV